MCISEITTTELHMTLLLGQFKFQRITSPTPQTIEETKAEQGKKTGTHCLSSDDWFDMHHLNLRVGS